MNNFDYAAPTSLAEATALLAQPRPDGPGAGRRDRSPGPVARASRGMRTWSWT